MFPVLYNTSLSLSYTQQFVPPPLPLVTTSLFSISVSLLMLYYSILLNLLSPVSFYFYNVDLEPGDIVKQARKVPFPVAFLPIS